MLFRKCFVSGLLLAAVGQLFAQQIYFTNEPKQSLQKLDTSTGAISTLFATAGKPDDLTLNSQGQLLYSIPQPGTVNLFDPTKKTTTVLMRGVPYARDLAVEPGGLTMLVAIYSPGKILRYNFSARTYTTLAPNVGGTCDGIAYDAYGNLYAVANHNTIIQVDSKTGKTLKTLVLESHNGVNGADGLTYDPYSGHLWATHAGTTGKGLVEIVTTPGGGFSKFNLHLFTSQLAGSAPDGIKSDGKGNLYVGAINTIFKYNLAGNSIADSWIVGGADGVSLVPGTY